MWVRWRILANRMSRRGKMNSVLFAVLVLLGAMFSVGSFLATFLIGVVELPEAESMEIWGVWVGLSIAFLLFWMIGLMTELSRSDSLSIKNLLHLPVSLGWVFINNYLSSFVSLSIAFFLPAMLGLALAMTKTFGAIMLLCFPLVLGFFLLVTALTYHLRGWLARLMEDKRKGKNIVMGITFGFVLLVQIPNFINMATSGDQLDGRIEKYSLQSKARMEGPDQEQAIAELEAFLKVEEAEALVLERRLILTTQVIPFGWLPYGMHALHEKRILPITLCLLGFYLLAGLSLRRSYRTTMRGIVEGEGHGSGIAAGSKAGKAKKVKSMAQGIPLVERNLPWMSDEVSGITFANLRSLLRAPETKMMMLGPIIMFAFMGMMLAKKEDTESYAALFPAMSLGAISMGMISVNQLLQNQFGLDRAGFRAFVLSPVPRARILIAKNLTLAPFGLGIGILALCGFQFFAPADANHFFGAFLQVFSAFMLLCLLGNTLSIYAPIRMREMGTKAVKPKFSTFVLQFLTLVFVPLTLAPLLLPWGVEYLLQRMGWASGLPVYLLLHGFMLCIVFLLYRWFIRQQGEILQGREQEILDVLTRD